MENIEDGATKHFLSEKGIVVISPKYVPTNDRDRRNRSINIRQDEIKIKPVDVQSIIRHLLLFS